MKNEWYAVVRKEQVEGTSATLLRCMTVFSSREIAEAHAIVDGEDYPNLGPYLVVPLIRVIL